MFQGQEYDKEAIRYLTWLSAQVGEQNKLGLTDMNHAAESFYSGLLNLVYGWNLVNINIEEPNAAAIDLGDLDEGIAIQVTSTGALPKTRKTVKKFVEKGLNKDYKRLLILNIARKTNHKENVSEGSYTFDREKDLLGVSDVIRVITSMPTEKKKSVIEYLRSELKVGFRPTVAKDVSTLMKLIERISDDGHPAVGQEFLEEPFPAEKIERRFSDHATFLKQKYFELSAEYGSVLEAVMETADFGEVRIRRAVGFLRSFSDSALHECNDDPVRALDLVISRLGQMLSDNGFEHDARAVEFYVVKNLMKCNVFPYREAPA